MPKTMTAANLCAMSAEEFWALRLDMGFDEFQAAERRGGFKVLDEVVADGVIKRTTVLTYEENPIPERLRGYLGASEFSFKVTSSWNETLYDQKNGMSFISEPPVMADRIKVSGTQWVEAISATQCRVHQTASIAVNVFGLGSQVEAALTKQMEESSGNLPKMAEQYTAILKQQAAEAEAAAAEAAATTARLAAEAEEPPPLIVKGSGGAFGSGKGFGSSQASAGVAKVRSKTGKSLGEGLLGSLAEEADEDGVLSGAVDGVSIQRRL